MGLFDYLKKKFSKNEDEKNIKPVEEQKVASMESPVENVDKSLSPSSVDGKEKIKDNTQEAYQERFHV